MLIIFPELFTMVIISVTGIFRAGCQTVERQSGGKSSYGEWWGDVLRGGESRLERSQSSPIRGFDKALPCPNCRDSEVIWDQGTSKLKRWKWRMKSPKSNAK